MVVKISEKEFKILHLLNTIPIEKRYCSAIAKKMKIGYSTVYRLLVKLEDEKFTKSGMSETGRKHYFLRDYLRETPLCEQFSVKK